MSVPGGPGGAGASAYAAPGTLGMAASGADAARAAAVQSLQTFADFVAGIRAELNGAPPPRDSWARATHRRVMRWISGNAAGVGSDVDNDMLDIDVHIGVLENIVYEAAEKRPTLAPALVAKAIKFIETAAKRYGAIKDIHMFVNVINAISEFSADTGRRWWGPFGQVHAKGLGPVVGSPFEGFLRTGANIERHSAKERADRTLSQLNNVGISMMQYVSNIVHSVILSGKGGQPSELDEAALEQILNRGGFRLPDDPEERRLGLGSLVSALQSNAQGFHIPIGKTLRDMQSHYDNYSTDDASYYVNHPDGRRIFYPSYREAREHTYLGLGDSEHKANEYIHFLRTNGTYIARDSRGNVIRDKANKPKLVQCSKQEWDKLDIKDRQEGDWKPFMLPIGSMDKGEDLGKSQEAWVRATIERGALWNDIKVNTEGRPLKSRKRFRGNEMRWLRLGTATAPILGVATYVGVTAVQAVQWIGSLAPIKAILSAVGSVSSVGILPSLTVGIVAGGIAVAPLVAMGVVKGIKARRRSREIRERLAAAERHDAWQALGTEEQASRRGTLKDMLKAGYSTESALTNTIGRDVTDKDGQMLLRDPLGDPTIWTREPRRGNDPNGRNGGSGGFDPDPDDPEPPLGRASFDQPDTHRPTRGRPQDPDLEPPVPPLSRWPEASAEGTTGFGSQDNVECLKSAVQNERTARWNDEERIANVDRFFETVTKRAQRLGLSEETVLLSELDKMISRVLSEQDYNKVAPTAVVESGARLSATYQAFSEQTPSQLPRPIKARTQTAKSKIAAGTV